MSLSAKSRTFILVAKLACNHCGIKQPQRLARKQVEIEDDQGKDQQNPPPQAFGGRDYYQPTNAQANLTVFMQQITAMMKQTKQTNQTTVWALQAIQAISSTTNPASPVVPLAQHTAPAIVTNPTQAP